MESKVFLIEEHKETIFDAEQIDQWKAIVQELGMTEQEKLINGEDKVSPIPFPVMTEVEQTIYGSILDTHTEYKAFGGEAVPLSVLSAISLCEKEKYFDKIEIWYSRQNPDPWVIGKRYADAHDKQNKYDWRMVHYKIAQWGGKIESLAKLLPAWDKMKRAELKSNYDYQVKDHEKKMEQFQLQIVAFK